MEESLVRPEFRRRRRWTGVAIALAIPAQLVTLYALLLRPDRTTYITTIERIETTQVVTVPSPPVIVMPTPTPVTTVDARSCPLPRTDAPRFKPPELPETMTGLAVSRTNAGWIAAWNEDHVFVSTDAGRRFERVLDGPGVVHAAQFDCFGHVVVSRGDQIGVSDAGRETWHPLEGLDLAAQGSGEDVWQPNVGLIGGGRDLMVIGPRTGDQGGARLAVSRDLGASWQYHDFSQYSSASGGTGFQRADGSIVAGVDVPDCMSDDLSWVSIDRDGHVKTGSISMSGGEFQYYGEWIYSAYGRRKIAVSDDAPWEPVGVDGTWWGTPIPAPYPVFVVDETAGRIATTTRRAYPLIVDGEHAQMDPAGRLWTLQCGKLWIATKDRSYLCGQD